MDDREAVLKSDKDLEDSLRNLVRQGLQRRDDSRLCKSRFFSIRVTVSRSKARYFSISIIIVEKLLMIR